VKIYDAFTLIHFDFPIELPTKRKLPIVTSRFAVMWETFRNIAKEDLSEDTRWKFGSVSGSTLQCFGLDTRQF